MDSENESEIIVTESKTSGKRKRVGCNGNAQALKKGKKSDNCWFTQEGTIVTPKKEFLLVKMDIHGTQNLLHWERHQKGTL